MQPRYRLRLLLSLLLLVPACGGDAPAPEAPPAAPDVQVELTADIDPVDNVEEVVEDSGDPAPQDLPAAVPLPDGLPPLDAAALKTATETLQPVQGLLADLLARYATGMAAKRTGDDAGWRTALGEAVTLGHEVQDRWNEVIGAMPANENFDEEETAALYFPAGHSAVVDTVDAMRNIERQLGR